MNDVLKENLFVKEISRDIWKKKNWTIRFTDSEIEAYNNPLYPIIGLYHKCEKTPENLLNIIEDVNSFIENEI